jgi:hypothetical protein
MPIVHDVTNGRKVKWVGQVFTRWERIRLQPQEVIQRIVLIRILNGIWMAHNRGQKSDKATIWIAAESYPRSMMPSMTIDLAKRIIQRSFDMVRKHDYLPHLVLEEDKFILYRSSSSKTSEIVVLVGATVANTSGGRATDLRAQLFKETKLLPTQLKGKARKKKK